MNVFPSLVRMILCNINLSVSCRIPQNIRIIMYPILGLSALMILISYCFDLLTFEFQPSSWHWEQIMAYN